MAGGEPYLVLQFVDGGNLREVIRPGGVELERAAQIIRQVSNALTAAHDKGILHRDLKPDNVMLQMRDGEERVVVIDFGIAQVQDSVIAPKTIVTATAGTMYYMSPEQLTAGALTPASDTYALGVIAYELVTGEKPFTPKSPFQLLEMQRAGVSVTPRQLRPDLPDAAEAAILRALSFDAGARHQRTCEFGQELQRAVAGLPPAATLRQTAAAASRAAFHHAGEPHATGDAVGAALRARPGGASTPRRLLPQPRPRRIGRSTNTVSAPPAQTAAFRKQQFALPPRAEVSKPRSRAPVALIVGGRAAPRRRGGFVG